MTKKKNKSNAGNAPAGVATPQPGVKKTPLKQSGQASGQADALQLLSQMFQSGSVNTTQVVVGLSKMLQQGGDGNGGDSAKSLLNQWFHKKMGQNPTKADFVYKSVEVPQSKPTQYVSHLTIPSIHASRVYSGQPSSSKKAAELSAATQALKANGQAAPKPAAAGSPQPPAAMLMDLLGSLQGAGGAGGGGAGGAGGAGGGGGAGAGVDNSKELVHQWIGKSLGRHPTKSDTKYTTNEVPESKPTQYVSSLVILSIDLNRSYQGQPSLSKKAAELSAARQALKENGQSTGQVKLSNGGGNPINVVIKNNMKGSPGAGAGGGVGDNSKELLSHCVAKATGKSPTKDELYYTTTEVPMTKPTMYVCSLVVLSMDPSRAYTGQPSPSKKAAEMSAARQALLENGEDEGQVQGGGVASSSKNKKNKKKKNK